MRTGGEMCLIIISPNKTGFLFIMHNIIPFMNSLLILGWNVTWTCFETFIQFKQRALPLSLVCVCVGKKSILCISPLYITVFGWYFYWACSNPRWPFQTVTVFLWPIASSLDFFCIVMQYKDILIPLSLYIFRKRLLRSVLF